MMATRVTRTILAAMLSFSLLRGADAQAVSPATTYSEDTFIYWMIDDDFMVGDESWSKCIIKVEDMQGNVKKTLTVNNDNNGSTTYLYARRTDSKTSGYESWSPLGWGIVTEAGDVYDMRIMVEVLNEAGVSIAWSDSIDVINGFYVNAVSDIGWRALNATTHNAGAIPFSSTPEPSSGLMLLLGSMLLILKRKKKASI